jgi:hypothetical protein
MNSITDIYRMRQAASLASCAPPAPVCGICGMLECVCRPRFFAGQVLNADDLNRLDAYIRAKHRLHNRQLHGWGVVNGLEVTCNPCGAGVTVSCGYALSPCGEDIVVCDAVTVDVCELIRRCKDAELQLAPCDPPRPYARGEMQGPCDAAEEDWVLAIRYSESPARGVKPLYLTATTDCGCGAAGSCSCKSNSGTSSTSIGGCGCGGSTTSGAGTAAKPRGAPVQCEPTVICEGYSFEIYRLPAVLTSVARSTKSAVLDSPLLQHFECCVQDLTTKAPKPPQQRDLRALYLWALRFKDFLLRHFQTKPGYNCELLARLQTLAIPDPQQQNNTAPFFQAIELLGIVFVDALLACLCSALLPPCPEPTSDVRVPLAGLHVGSNPCRVMRVCNWSTHRKFATTFPALQYWLSVSPIMRNIRQLLDKMCCFDLAGLLPHDRLADAHLEAMRARAATGTTGTGETAATTGSTGGGTLQERMLLRLNPALDDPAPVQDSAALFARTLFGDRGALTPQSIVESLVGPIDLERKEGAPLSALESANLPHFMLLQQLVKPITDSTLAPAMAHLTRSGLFGISEPQRAEAPAAAASGDEIVEIRRELAALRVNMQAQADEIARLRTSTRDPNR